MSGDASPIPALSPRERTLPALLARQAAFHGDRPLVGFADAAWSFAEARVVAARAAAALARAGVARGERVAILAGNRAIFLRVALGCAWLGAVAVPINTAAKAPQLRHVLEDSGAVALLVEDEFAPLLAELGPTSLRTVWTARGAAGPAWPDGEDEAPPAALGPGDPFAILYTSGTTGPSKGVVCPHAQFVWWGENSARVLGVGADDVLCTTLPLFHVNALNTFAQALLTGARQVVELRFSASGFWPTVARHGATVGYLLGAMVPILLAQPVTAAERAHRVRIALGPGVPGPLHAVFRERTGVRLVEGYGSTESNFVIATEGGTPEGSVSCPPGTMGRVRDGFEARVVDEDDNERPPGEPGELILRAREPFAFASGYHNRPEATLAAWRNLWLHTGDRVTCDADGVFRFVDRLKDAIRRRGENISSFEVEQAVLAHPCVEAAAAFPVRSELAEDEVMVAAVRKAGATLKEADLLRHCEPLLPRFALPRFVEFVEALPVTENGKVQKFKLRERGVGPATWDRENPARSPDRPENSA